MDDTANVVGTFWRCAEERDWAGFAALLAPEVRYEAPADRAHLTERT